MERIRESENDFQIARYNMIRSRINKFKVLTVSGVRGTSYDIKSGVQVTISRSETSLLKLNTAFLIGFGSLVVLDVVFRYLLLYLLYIKTKIRKNRCLMLD